jgi:acetyl esterase/lipase
VHRDINWRRQVTPVPEDKRVPVIIWGQSIGAGIASNCSADSDLFIERLHLKTLILETPFTNIRDMLVALYPQKWLPYRHLWPFLRNYLDSMKALERLSKRPLRSQPQILILQAGRDEIVPETHGNSLFEKCQNLGLRVKKVVIRTAFHVDVMMESDGRNSIVDAIEEAAKRPDDKDVTGNDKDLKIRNEP